MKILIVTDAWHPQVNGVVRTYEYLSEKMIADGHDVHIIGPANFSHQIALPGYSEIKLALFPYRRLCSMIDGYKPDIIHIATEGALGWAARRYCLRHNISFTTSYHTQFPEYTARRVAKYIPFLHGVVFKMGVSFIKKFHAPASAIFVTTQSMRDMLQSWGIETPMLPLTRGIDTSLFYPHNSEVQNTLFKDLPRPIALYVGRLAIEKSVEDFLSMPWQGSKVVIGHGPQEKELKEKFPDAHFIGKKTGQELADHYRASDVFVFPSSTDTFGIVLIEALACGIPIAAYDVIGPRDIVTDPALGALEKDLSVAATKALQHGDGAQTRHKYITENYTWEKAAQQFYEGSK